MATPAQQPTPTRTRPRPGDELELTVDALAFGGAGVARSDGYVVFVDGAVPGDRVRAHVGKAKRAYGHAAPLEILEPSPERIAPVADHPGAPWQVLPYERQLEVKQEQVDEALRAHRQARRASRSSRSCPRSSSGATATSSSTRSAPARTARWSAASTPPAAGTEIVPIADCLLASERGNAVREQVLAWARDAGPGRLRPPDAAGVLRNLVVREGRRTGELQVRLVAAPGDLPPTR